jgi:hypothetical protein
MRALLVLLTCLCLVACGSSTTPCQGSVMTCVAVSACEPDQGHITSKGACDSAEQVCCVPVDACPAEDFACCSASERLRPLCNNGELVCDQGETKCDK